MRFCALEKLRKEKWIASETEWLCNWKQLLWNIFCPPLPSFPTALRFKASWHQHVLSLPRIPAFLCHGCPRHQGMSCQLQAQRCQPGTQMCPLADCWLPACSAITWWVMARQTTALPGDKRPWAHWKNINHSTAFSNEGFVFFNYILNSKSLFILIYYKRT